MFSPHASFRRAPARAKPARRLPLPVEPPPASGEAPHAGEQTAAKPPPSPRLGRRHGGPSRPRPGKAGSSAPAAAARGARRPRGGQAGPGGRPPRARSAPPAGPGAPTALSRATRGDRRPTVTVQAAHGTARRTLAAPMAAPGIMRFRLPLALSVRPGGPAAAGPNHATGPGQRPAGRACASGRAGERAGVVWCVSGGGGDSRRGRPRVKLRDSDTRGMPPAQGRSNRTRVGRTRDHRWPGQARAGPLAVILV